MLQLKRWLITFAVLILIVASLGFIKFTQIKAAIAFGESFPEASETVNATAVKRSSWQPEVLMVGEVKAQRTVAVRNEVEGIITKVNFKSGAAVGKGDLLVQLNVDTESALVDAINAEIDLANLDVKRFSDLLVARASSKEPLDRAKAQLAVLKARARGVQASISKKTITAPFSGLANIHDWQVGTYVAANTVITNLVGQDNAIWIDFSLPQQYANIAIGSELKVVHTADSSTPMVAKLVALNQQLDSSSRTLQARAHISNPSLSMKPGMMVSVKVPSGKLMSVMPLPNQAIRYDTFGSYVFVLNKDENDNYRAVRTPVVVASKQADISYVSSGLEVGQLVATKGSAKLRSKLLTYISSTN